MNHPNRPIDTPRHVVIVGAGITGLAAAYYLQKQSDSEGPPITYTLIESESRIGGNLITEYADGLTIEHGPDCFLRQKPWAAQLCREIGLADELIGTNDDRRKVFVVNRGKLTPLPDGVMLIVPTRIQPFLTSPLFSWPAKLRMGMDIFIPARRDGKDESVGEFVRRRLGREALEKLAEPLMSGIHVSDPESQSLLGTFPRFRDLEVKYGSLIRGMLASRKLAGAHPSPTAGPNSLFISLRRGMGQMVDALEGHLAEGSVRTNTTATRLERREGGGYCVHLAGSQTIDADAVVLTTPAYVSGELVAEIAPTLAHSLREIRYVSTALVSLAFRRQEFEHPLDGFGFVSPRVENRRMSACTWTSTKFSHRAPDDVVLLRAFVGGPHREEQVDMSDDELRRLVLEELRDLMGVTAVPFFHRVHRWPRTNPQYAVGHLERTQSIYAQCSAQPGLFVAGSAFEGVGIPDCVRQGQQAADRVGAFLSSRAGAAHDERRRELKGEPQ
jgi:protoporphyrinogen/coproporphyrinogen III oxidase